MRMGALFLSCASRPCFGCRILSAGLALLCSLLLAACSALSFFSAAAAHDSGPLKDWFNSLESGRGPCCSGAEGRVLSNVDWQVRDGHYVVLLNDQWVPVPDEAVLHQPNLAGPTMVWPIWISGKPVVRCFMVGSGT